MSKARIESIGLTATHDGEAAFVIALAFPNGGRSKVQIEAVDMEEVLARAGASAPMELVGRPWDVLDVKQPLFMGRGGKSDEA